MFFYHYDLNAHWNSMTFLQHIISEKSFARFFVCKFVIRLSTKFWNLRPTFPIDTLGGSPPRRQVDWGLFWHGIWAFFGGKGWVECCWRVQWKNMCFFCYLIWGSSTFFWVFNGKIRWVWFGWYELKFDLSVKLQGFPRQACIWSVPFLLLGHRAGFLTPTKIETAILHVESQSSNFVWFSEPSPSQQETTPDSRNCLYLIVTTGESWPTFWFRLGIMGNSQVGYTVETLIEGRNCMASWLGPAWNFQWRTCKNDRVVQVTRYF